jgi:hypothetical protein
MRFEGIYDLKFLLENISGLKKNTWRERIISMKNIEVKQLYMLDLFQL